MTEGKDWITIDYEESGGFTGLARRCRLDSRNLDDAQAEELMHLVKASGILESEDPATKQQSTGLHFHFGLETPTIKRSLVFHSSTLPEELIEIRDYLYHRSSY